MLISANPAPLTLLILVPKPPFCFGWPCIIAFIIRLLWPSGLRHQLFGEKRKMLSKGTGFDPGYPRRNGNAENRFFKADLESWDHRDFKNINFIFVVNNMSGHIQKVTVFVILLFFGTKQLVDIYQVQSKIQLTWLWQITRFFRGCSKGILFYQKKNFFKP